MAGSSASIAAAGLAAGAAGAACWVAAFSGSGAVGAVLAPQAGQNLTEASSTTLLHRGQFI
jgi:hypothetical protein